MKYLPRLSRRRFLKLPMRSVLPAALGVAVYTRWLEPHWIEVVRRELPIARLPEVLAGKTLVHISDLHIGPVVDEGYISRALQQVSALEADILVVTGDFMTYDSDEQIEQTARVLRHLRPGRLATLGVLGNHDYGPHWSDETVADRLSARLRGAGIDLLQNAKRDVFGLEIAGIDDLWSPRFKPDDVLRSLAAERANLVLCHNPDAADLPVWHGYRGWILCGHTHGGQCKPPFLPPPVLPVRNARYTAGEIDLYDGRRLYINRALGHLAPVRFNVRPEITVFTLRRADA